MSEWTRMADYPRPLSAEECGAQALREYELKHDKREPFESANEHVKNSWRQAYRRLAECFDRYGLQVGPKS